MNERKCSNCGEKIKPEKYDSTSAKADYPANAAAWIGGFCSRWCMVATAMTQVKAGNAWWQMPDTEEWADATKEFDD